MLGALAILASGCGGGDDAVATDPAAAAAPAPATDASGATVAGADPSATGAAGTPGAATDPTAAAAGGAAGADTSVPGANEIAGANAAAGSPVTVSAITPKKFAKAHCAKPIIVVFYQPGAVVDERLYAEAAAAAASVKGVVSLAFTPRDTKLYGDLPAKLGLLSTPGLAIVSRAGELENFWVTYVDRALIRRSLQNAASAKPCKVGADDAPVAGEAAPAAKAAKPVSPLANAALVANGGTIPATANPLAATAPAAGTPGGAPAATGLDAAATGAVAPVS